LTLREPDASVCPEPDNRADSMIVHSASDEQIDTVADFVAKAAGAH
jgi:hypothetical protein